jgi:preprotein translocase subunit SecD
VLYQQETDKATGRTSRTPYLVQKRVILTGGDLNDAQVDLSGASGKGPAVSMNFNNRGGRTFALVTEENVGKRPAIASTTTSTGAGHPGEDHRRARADQRPLHGRGGHRPGDRAARRQLPAPVEILEERSVGPSLGSDLVKKGVLATLAATLVVLIFMGIYYALSGMVANLALVANLFLLLGVMAAFGASLTLPGIAGIVLTLGMAVDANVLIFERIREELRAGRAIKAAVENGYSRAFVTILDSNVTTVLTAVVLLVYGSGPVKGFAVTLSIGLIVSMFTAVVVTRWIFDYVLMTRPVAKLSI